MSATLTPLPFFTWTSPAAVVLVEDEDEDELEPELGAWAALLLEPVLLQPATISATAKAVVTVASGAARCQDLVDIPSPRWKAVERASTRSFLARRL
jgi:hypothetical protein